MVFSREGGLRELSVKFGSDGKSLKGLRTSTENSGYNNP